MKSSMKCALKSSIKGTVGLPLAPLYICALCTLQPVLKRFVNNIYFSTNSLLYKSSFNKSLVLLQPSYCLHSRGRRGCSTMEFSYLSIYLLTWGFIEERHILRSQPSLFVQQIGSHKDSIRRGLECNDGLCFFYSIVYLKYSFIHIILNFLHFFQYIKDFFQKENIS